MIYLILSLLKTTLDSALMARFSGTRNADYEETRSRILKALRGRLLEAGPDKVSFREMAQHAGVSAPTLRHYFANRTTVVQAVFSDLHRDGLRYLDEAGRAESSLSDSLQQAADAILAGIRFGRMDQVHALGLTEGLGHGELGPSYLHSILEPSLQALERRFESHRDRGELSAVPVRYAALAFAAPLILAALHQSRLGGDCVRPLDLADFARNHVRAFALAYGNVSDQ